MSCIRGTAIHIIQCYWVVVVVSKWSFENILVATPPKNTCDCRAPLGLPRRRGCATSHPHSTPMTCRQMNGCRAQFGGQGAWRGSRGRVCSLPGVAGTLKTAATPELHLASRRLALAPRPSYTTALRFAAKKWAPMNDSASGGLSGKSVLTPRGGA